ncbi:recombinase family protein, partial [bacterium]|nr:recombinase family protein [bacterium]
MTPERQSLVRAANLSRAACLYVRQSTLRQVAENTESTRRQYALRERAEALGWTADQIQVIDCDQGISGTTAAERSGFQRLVTEVSMGRVGIVMGLEVSRLARNCSDWHRLVELCAVTGTLILDQDGLYDPTTFNHQLVLGIKGFMSAVGVSILRARMRGGLLAKAARGELRIGLPVGFVYDEQDKVRLHPDVQVRQSIELLFETFRRAGTACATVKYFGDEALLFPRPAGQGGRGVEVLWKPLELQTVVRVLHNPRYAGAFAYGRRTTERRPGGGWRTTKVPRERWHSLVLDAHPGYINWDEFERNEQQLRRSALAYGLENRRSPPREGPALLQGLVLCGVCGGRMTVRYHARSAGLVPDYQCIAGRTARARPVCQVIPGASIDRAVGERLVAAMTPMAIEVTLAVRAELQARLDDADRLRMRQVERAQQEVQFARRRYMQVDPDNRLVASTLEADWNNKLRLLAQARDEAERQRAADQMTLEQATETRIRALAEDFPTVWGDPATPHRDRKRMAQLLIEDVTLLKSKELRVHIRFKGGATESLVLPRPETAWLKRMTHPDVVARIEQLLERHEEEEAAERLNAEGLRTGAGEAFDATAVRWVRYAYGLKTPAERLRETGKLTIR